MFVSLPILILYVTSVLVSSLNITGDDVEIIQFAGDQLRGRSSPYSFIVANSIYLRYQETFDYIIGVSSDVFSKIPGLTFAISHDRPMLYRLQFQGSCVLSPQNNNGFVRFLIDGRVLISNYLLNNNDQRQLLAPELGSSVGDLDHRGGGMTYSATGGVGVGMACPKSDIVYMPQGTHIVEVAARIRYPGAIRVLGGQLSIELTQYDSDVNLGLSHPVIR